MHAKVNDRDDYQLSGVKDDPAAILYQCFSSSYLLPPATARREMAPKPGRAAAANSSIMAPEPVEEWA
jgi:hypothetical protein